MADDIMLLASDSKPFIRGGEDKKFKGCLGVCLGFSHPESFNTIYDPIIDAICKEIGVKKQRTVLKSYDISRMYQNERARFIESLGVFVREIFRSGVGINCVFSYFNIRYLPSVIKYGAGRDPTQTVKTLDFINELSECYPYIAAWKVIKMVNPKPQQIYLDHFTGEITPAWDELIKQHQVFIVPNGDYCSPFISSADIVARYLDEFLSLHHLTLNEASISAAFTNCGVANPNIFYVGNPDIRDIVPRIKQKIRYADYYQRPLCFILKEGLFKAEHNFIESSPLWNKILDFAYNKHLGIKFMSFEEDHKIIRSGDYLIHLGDEGKKQAEYLRALGYDIVPISISDVLRG